MKTPQSISDFKAGQTVTFNHPLLGNVEGMVMFVNNKSLLYPLTNENGIRGRNTHNDDNKLIFVSAEEEGNDPDEVEIQVDIVHDGGSLTITENAFKEIVSSYEVKIDEDKPLNKEMEGLNKMILMMEEFDEQNMKK